MKEKELIRLIDAAQLYYEKGLTQAEVAKQMNISRPSVSNLLSKAKEVGIVEIKVKSFESTPFGKARALMEHFNLKSCNIIENTAIKKEADEQIYKKTAEVVMEHLKQSKVFGVGWGMNVSRVIDTLLKEEMDEKLKGFVCPMLGAATVPHKGYHPNELCTALGQRFGLTPQYLMSPAFPTSFQEQRLFVNTENYGNTMAYWKRIDTCIVTLGSYPCVPDQATASRFGRNLVLERAYGNMLSYFFNIHGERIRGEEDYAIQLPLKKLGSIKNFIGIVPPESNPKSVVSCLNTGFVKHLIMNESVATGVMKHIDDRA